MCERSSDCHFVSLFRTFRVLDRYCIFFFNDTATTEIYTLSLHDALPISSPRNDGESYCFHDANASLNAFSPGVPFSMARRSEEHTSELQSQSNLVCRLLLEKKKNYNQT